MDGNLTLSMDGNLTVSMDGNLTVSMDGNLTVSVDGNLTVSINKSALGHCSQSTVTVDESIGELQELMMALPDYADQFLTMVCNVLREYRDKCHSAYRDIVQHGADDRRVISAMWAKDEDISRFLRSSDIIDSTRFFVFEIRGSGSLVLLCSFLLPFLCSACILTFS